MTSISPCLPPPIISSRNPTTAANTSNTTLPLPHHHGNRPTVSRSVSDDSSSSSSSPQIVKHDKDDNDTRQTQQPPPHIMQSLAAILEKDRQRSMRIAALMIKKDASPSPCPPPPPPSVNNNNNHKETRPSPSFMKDSTIHVISNPLPLQTILDSSSSSSSSSKTCSSSKVISQHPSPYSTVAIIPCEKETKCNDPCPKQRGRKKRMRQEDSCMAFDARMYTKIELKKFAKQSRDACDEMEQREKKRLDALAEKLFYSSEEEVEKKKKKKKVGVR